MRHQGTENAALMLQLLQYDYADGAGDYGPVITEFSALLARYRQAFSAWQPMHEKGFWKKASRFPPMLKTAAMAAAAFALVTLFFPGGLDQGHFLHRRQRLVRLAPRLREEFYTLRAQLIEELGDELTEEDRALYGELPLLSWWDVPIRDLQEAERRYALSRVRDHVAWDTRWVQRQYGSEFQEAGSEYSPFLVLPETENASRQLYEDLKRRACEGGAVILDFISRGTSSSMETDTVTYQDYKYSSLQRFGAEMVNE